MANRPHKRYWVWCDDSYTNNPEEGGWSSKTALKPTIKSAYRQAKKWANETGLVFVFFNTAKRRKARRRGKCCSVFVVRPEKRGHRV